MASTATVDLAAAQAFPTFMDGREECAKVDPDLFYDLEAGKKRAARKVCARCELRDPCLAWALETRQEFGIWAGTTPSQRRELRRRGTTR